MSNKIYISLAALIGIFCGFISSHSFFFHSWTSIFLWVGVGIGVLYLSKSRRDAMYGGITYGFITIATWLLTGFQGQTSQFRGLLAIITIAGLVGAVSGALGAVIFYLVFRRKS